MMTHEELKAFNELFGPVDGRRRVSRIWGLFPKRQFTTREEQEYAANNVDWLRDTFSIRKQEACGLVGCTPREYHRWSRLAQETDDGYRRAQAAAKAARAARFRAAINPKKERAA